MRTSITIGLLTLVAFLLAAVRINHGLVESALPPGQGMTLDEGFNIQQGVYVFEACWKHGPLILTPSAAKSVFGDPQYLADHPPLVRVVLGFFHQVFRAAVPGSEDAFYNVPAARLGSCFLFAMTVLLLTEFTRRRYGLQTAVIAAVLLMLMPRVVGHARVAAQETGTSLAWLAAVIPLLTWWTADRPPTTKQALVSGLLWGILLSSKVQGILLPPVVFVWAVWQHRLRAIRPLIVWTVVGCVVFFVGWPWLWLDPVANTLKYLGRTTERPVLYVWYFGERFADRAVPWHYPFVMTGVTLPVCVLFGLLLRCCQRTFDRSEILLAATSVWPLIVFAIPGVPVYDSTRLYLVVMPGFALLAARGLMLAIRSEAGLFRRPAARGTCVVLMVCLALAAVPAVTANTSLCSYNQLVGGPAGAQWCGLEADFWTCGLNTEFWEQVPQNLALVAAPVTHPTQLAFLQTCVPIIQQRGLRLESFQYDPDRQRGLVLLMHRLADLPPMYRSAPPGADIVAERQEDGVVLAQVIDNTQHTWPPSPNWPGDPDPPDVPSASPTD
ncbi:MAG: glycosyltransferase family 39 protein [Planctomycetaceae bacterium]